MAIHLLGISGSLRKGSYNTAILHASGELLPEHVTLGIADISDFPLYNDDVRENGFPASVVRVGEQVAAADALLFVTPEYNYSVSGVLKNAIDWLSRLPEKPFEGKPVAIMGASTGNYGTARAQYHLRQICVFTNMHPMNKPEVLITRAHEKFDANGTLTDQPTREVIQKTLTTLLEWTQQLKKS